MPCWKKADRTRRKARFTRANEAQAKTEKRGVWSIENLKPAWQIRAEAEEKRQQEKLAAEKAAGEITFVEAMKLQRKPAVKRQMSSESQLLAMTTTAANVKLPDNIKIVGGLAVGYDPAKKIGVVATPMMNMDFADVSGKQMLRVQLVHLYFDGDESKGRQNIYLVAVISESKDFRFLKYNDLVVTADNQKFLLGKATRVARQNESGVVEGLEYQIKKNVFARIANSKNLKIKVGTYSGEAGGEIQALLRNFLQISL